MEGTREGTKAVEGVYPGVPGRVSERVGEEEQALARERMPSAFGYMFLAAAPSVFSSRRASPRLSSTSRERDSVVRVAAGAGPRPCLFGTHVFAREMMRLSHASG